VTDDRAPEDADDTPTPARPSKTMAIFRYATRRIIDRIDALGEKADEEARTIRHEAAQIEQAFEVWPIAPPTREEYLSFMNRALLAHHAAVAFFAKRGEKL
jgi:hypothetical protein